MEKKKEPEGLIKYLEQVRLAKLDQKSKALLWFYAYAFNWLERRPSYYTQAQICAFVGFSPGTYQKAKKDLEGLGWIKTRKISYDLPVLVTPKIGKDDLKYESYSWSKGHTGNKVTLDDAIDSLPTELRDPFFIKDDDDNGF
jgi:hypothetical protein